MPSLAFAGWRDQASDFDIQRLQILEQWRDKAIWEAQHYSDGTGDFNALKSTLEQQGRAVPVQALIGNWRCRNMKMGGMNAYIVYQWFDCRIVPMNGGLLLQKTTGSLRTQGWLYPETAPGFTWVRSRRAAKGWATIPAAPPAPARPPRPTTRSACSPASATTACGWKFPARWKNPPTTSSSSHAKRR